MKRALVALLALCALTACYEELDWREWRPQDGRFVLLLPSKPKEFVRDVSIGDRKLRLHMISADSDGLAFGLAYADIAPGVAPGLIENARDALVRNIGGSIGSESAIQVQGATGIEFQAAGISAGVPMVIRARLLRDDRRFYQVAFIGRQDRAAEVDTDFFLGSFRPQP